MKKKLKSIENMPSAITDMVQCLTHSRYSINIC